MKRVKPFTHHQGLTIIELMVLVLFIGIMLSLAVPNFYDLIERKRLTRTTEEIYNFFKFAHSESIKRGSQMYISIHSGNNWCLGLDDTSPCDCRVANACQFAGVENVINANSHPGVDLVATGFIDASTIKRLRFEGIRGMVDASGSVRILRTGLSTEVATNRMGLIRSCSNQLKSYPAC